jgi:hypothetical protein
MKTETIPMTLVGGHVLLDVAGVTTLLDTGSQLSFGSVPSLRLLGREHPIAPDLLGRATVTSLRDGLRRHTPVPPTFDFDALVGVDVLAGTTLELDWARGKMRLRTDERRTRENALPPMLPSGTLELNGRTVRVAFDTGAWRSYALPALVEDLPRCGMFEDYNPIFGSIRPQLVRVRTRLARKEQEIEIGVAPEPLAQVIESLGADMLVGNDVMALARKVQLKIG